MAGVLHSGGPCPCGSKFDVKGHCADCGAVLPGSASDKNAAVREVDHKQFSQGKGSRLDKTRAAHGKEEAGEYGKNGSVPAGERASEEASEDSKGNKKKGSVPPQLLAALAARRAKKS